MNKTPKFVFYLGLAFILVGCGTPLSAVDASRNQQPKRVYSTQLATILAFEEHVDLFPNLWTVVLAVDGVKVDRSSQEEKEPFTITPGTHQIRLFRRAGKFATSAAFNINLSPGQVLQIRSEWQNHDNYLWLENVKTGKIVAGKTYATPAW